MGASPQVLYGVLRTRDLVELYYGRRMVATVKESNPALTLNQPAQIMPPNPARIAWEIVLFSDAGFAQVDIWETGGQDDNVSAAYGVPTGAASVVIRRNFLTDLDTVTGPVFAASYAEVAQVYCRETILSPAPVDEGP